MQKESSSTIARNEGNVFFKKYNPNKPVQTNQNYIHQAIVQYNRALKLANKIEDIYKAHKNLGLCYEKMIALLGFPNIKGELKNEQYLFLLWDMCDHYSKALLNGYKCISTSAYNELVNKIKKVVITNITQLANNNISHVQRIASFFRNLKEIYYSFMGIVSRLYFNLGYESYMVKEYAKAKGHIYNSLNTIGRNYTEESYPYLDQETKDTFDDVNDSCKFYLRRISVQQLLLEGDHYFNLGINESESIDMEYIFLSLEKYREAYLQFETNEDPKDYQETDITQSSIIMEKPKQNEDIELEAICLNSLGKITYKIFKKKEKAKDLYNSCIQLGLSLYPKNVSNESWFINAKKDLELIRKLENESCSLKDEQEQTKIKEKYKSIFEELEEKAKDTNRSRFFKFILEKYPYKGYTKIPDISDEYCKDKKTFLKKLSQGYHPDKYSKTTEEEKLNYYIMAEISKIINSFYTEVKSIESTPTP